MRSPTAGRTGPPRAPQLGPVVELTTIGPDAYQRESDHRLMRTVLRQDHPRYEVTDQHTHLLVRRLSDAELHADAARVAPHLAPLSSGATEPTAAEEAAHTLFDAMLRAAREVASDDPHLMDEIRNMDAPAALAALKTASLPSDMIGPIADALTPLAPHTYSPAH
ncbi:hypothetical protein [Streptomyces sp. PT19]|uniref:hypothetical protein n=1 Tax=Streptomyces sp. PT19 TaxID=3452239 RepID=UPI003F7F10E0